MPNKYISETAIFRDIPPASQHERNQQQPNRQSTRNKLSVLAKDIMYQGVHDEMVLKVPSPTLWKRGEYQALAASLKKIQQHAVNLEGIPVLIIDTTTQKMHLIKDNQLIHSYSVSTSKYGASNESGSHQTPIGLHSVVQKIGDNIPLGTTFYKRESTGQIASIEKRQVDHSADHITSRIIWLKGEEPENQSSQNRGIYIHGTNEEGLLGTQASHGCIRMRNTDVITLYEMIDTNTLVEIQKTRNR